MMDENKENNKAAAIVAVILAVIIGLCMLTSKGCDSDTSDVVYDENGYLGYSDSFWEWVWKQ